MAERRKKAATKKAAARAAGDDGSALVPLGTDAIDADWRERLRERATADAAVSEGADDSGFPWINTRGGRARYNDEELEMPIRVVILGARHDYRYYQERFDPDNPGSPTCYALGVDVLKLAPPADLKSKENPTCEGCPNDAFGSDDRGKGKACSQRIRVACVPWTDDEGEMENVQGARIMFPTMSRKNYHQYAKKLTKGFGLPLYAAVAELDVKPHDKYQWEVTLKPVGAISDPGLLDVLEKRADEAVAALDQPPQIGAADGADGAAAGAGRPRQRRQKVAPKARGKARGGAAARDGDDEERLPEMKRERRGARGRSGF
jgi:hypothetical protein